MWVMTAREDRSEDATYRMSHQKQQKKGWHPTLNLPSALHFCFIYCILMWQGQFFFLKRPVPALPLSDKVGNPPSDNRTDPPPPLATSRRGDICSFSPPAHACTYSIAWWWWYSQTQISVGQDKIPRFFSVLKSKIKKCQISFLVENLSTKKTLTGLADFDCSNMLYCTVGSTPRQVNQHQKKKKKKKRKKKRWWWWARWLISDQESSSSSSSSSSSNERQWSQRVARKLLHLLGHFLLVLSLCSCCHSCWFLLMPCWCPCWVCWCCCCEILVVKLFGKVLGWVASFSSKIFF